LIAGCGYVGSALGAVLVGDGHDVWGLRRRVVSLPAGVHPIEADLGLPGTLGDLPDGLDFVFYMASPGGSDDALYRAAYVEGLGNLIQALRGRGQSPRRVFFASSTAVYGQDQGEWVDEDSPAAPRHFSGRRLLEAERLLRDCPHAATVVRFGGIYGPRRTGIVERVRTGNARFRVDPPHYTNRIHLDDCVGVLRHLLGLTSPATLYLGVDCEPADEATVLNWLAGALGAPAPRPAPPDEGPRARGNKRCGNARLLASGYVFRHPTFREGYTALLADSG
jgi:nucleoside-diphosphate-sugar epimerase